MRVMYSLFLKDVFSLKAFILLKGVIFLKGVFLLKVLLAPCGAQLCHFQSGGVPEFGEVSSGRLIMAYIPS